MSIDLKSIDREELLQTRLCDLPISIEGSWIEQCHKKLLKELQNKGLKFSPHIWISEDWFCPDGVPGFAIPFYLLHPRLQCLEREYIGEVEGGNRNWCMMLMRHEVGHSIDNAYHLRKNKTRQALFGLTSKPYPTSYRPNRYSKQYVRHLDDNYAQAHPDEDWAETFAVWLTPNSSWKRDYTNWPALRKLEHLELMIKRVTGKKAPVSNKKRVDDISQLTMTLQQYFNEKRKRLKLNKKSPLKSELKRIFPRQGQVPAWRYVNLSQGHIIGQVAKNTDLHHYKIKIMLREVQKTCRQEGLMIDRPSPIYYKRIIQLMSERSFVNAKEDRSRIIM